ncbi:MAG: M42 family metallopeptidase [Solirubrobacterales bacterium]|nr:M42 family metallopeptidase [Solirubrobacterales bacterium]MBV9166396.1 M42 family metallopeptidase [Solirubrobacterales bacterium]MBV9534482.1 M42 family metallopeptidase [Solirubrobacterales bacterium]
MSSRDLLRDLLTAAGPSGYETDPARVWREYCRGFATEVASDNVGSSHARVPGTSGGPSLAVVGHIDEIGLHVTHIDDEGYLRFGGVGGWDPAVLVGQRIRLQTREGPLVGVIGRKPIHLLKEDDRKKVPELKHLHIDIGAVSGDEARQRVRIGDVGVIDGEPVELPNRRVSSRALDNRIGCHVAAETARLVAEAGGAPGDVIAVAAAQEETGFGGSRTSAYGLRPDLAIAVDVTFATDQPGIELGEMTKHGLGAGPVIARGTTLHPRIFELLYEAAEQEGVEFTVESLGRRTGTDADAIYVSRAGIPTGLVSVPLRYMHSPVEMVSLHDLEATARLIAAFARRLEPGMSFER